MKHIFAIFTAAALMLTFSSCADEDNPTNPGNNETAFDYMPLSEGNYWEYTTYGVDANRNTTDEVMDTYTLTIGAQTTIEGKTAFEMISDNNSEDMEPTYMSVDENNVYVYIPPFEEEEMGFQIDIGWIKYFSISEESWEAYTMEFKDSIDVGGGQKIEFDVTSTATGYNKGKTTVEFEGESYDAYNLEMISKTVSKFEINGTPQQQERMDTTRFIFAKGIGMYSSTSYYQESVEGNYGSYEVVTDFEIK